MRDIKIDKVTLNIGVGESGEPLEKAVTLLERISEMKPIRTTGKKRIPTWKVRPGLAIGAKVTLRKEKAKEILKRAFQAVDNRIKASNFDEFGNFGFGVHEYIDFPGIKYDPKLGMWGFDVYVTLSRSGYRVAKRKRKRQKIPRRHRITKDEAIEYIKNEFGVEVV